MPAEAPSAPAAIEAPPPPPAPTSEIHVTPATVDTGPKAPPPKKGSAQERMFEKLRSRAKPQFFETPDAPATPEQSPSTAESPNGDNSAESPAPSGTADSPTPEGATTDPKAAPAKEGKKNPWKLVDEYKARATRAESELLESKKLGGDPAKIQEFQTTIQNLQKQNEDLEKEIRFTNYAKSSEFKSKYQEPYEKAWARAVKELSEVTITDPGTNQERAASLADLADIVQLPLGKARAAAESVFGPFADDVMAYRKEIIGLYEAQETALKEARDTSIKRDKDFTQAQQKAMGESAAVIKATWEKANQEYLENKDFGTLFKPVDGDQDGNQRLSKGFEMVDKAWSENPNANGLTPEQRAAIVKRHAAVRLRAAGFGRLKAWYSATKSENEALKKELAQYKDSVPRTGGTSSGTPAAQQTSRGMSGIRERLQKIAH